MNRRQRGALESLASVALGFESIIVFLGGLVVFGLRVLPEPIAPWWGIVGGAVVALLMVAAVGVLRYRWGVAFGWVLQAVVALSALLVPAMLVVALIFGGMYAYATIKGASLDRINAQRARDADSTNGD